MRSGFQPGVVQDSINTDFTVGDDEEDSGPESSQSRSEEGRSLSDGGDQGQGPDESDSRYDGLDDGNVWKTKDSHDV